MGVIRKMCGMCRDCFPPTTARVPKVQVTVHSQELPITSDSTAERLIAVLLPRGERWSPTLARLDQLYRGQISARFEQERFEAEMDDSILIALHDGTSAPLQLLVIGVGDDQDDMQLCCSFGRAVNEAYELNVERLLLDATACKLKNARDCGHILRCRTSIESNTMRKTKLKQLDVFCREADAAMLREGALDGTYFCMFCDFPVEE
jgi:hypothetical protein